MKTRFLLLLIGVFFATTNSTKAQTYGQWVGATEPVFWEYNLPEVTPPQVFNTSGGIKISTAPDIVDFLPIPPSGSTRAYIAAGSGAAFEKSGTSLKITSGNVGIGKFSAYGITNATAVTSIFFDINFNSNLASNGNFILGIGKNANGNVFNNTNNITGDLSGGVFGALQFAFFGSTNVQVLYRKPIIPVLSPATFNYSPNNVLLIPNRTSGPIRVEIYCNNHTVTRSYVRSGTTYNLPPQTFNVFIGGVAAVIDAVTNFPATSEGIVAGDILDAFSFSASGSSNANLPDGNVNKLPNLLNFTLSNIKVGGVPQSVLPVTFTSFNGIKQGNAVQLNWTTASESDNLQFDILRSDNGADFKSIGDVKSKGDSDSESRYNFIDNTPVNGTYYYKLRQTDKDGKYTDYDKILSFNVGLNANGLSAYVNSNNSLVVNYNTTKATPAEIVVSDITGKTIIIKKVQLKDGVNQFLTDMSFVSNGVYVATVKSSTESNSLKFIKE